MPRDKNEWINEEGFDMNPYRYMSPPPTYRVFDLIHDEAKHHGAREAAEVAERGMVWCWWARKLGARDVGWFSLRQTLAELYVAYDEMADRECSG